MKIGNKLVFKNNHSTLYLYDYSRMIYYKILKSPIFTLNSKFQINACFEYFTHEPIGFANYIDKSI